MIKGASTLWLLIFGISLLAALFFGRIYCGWICPMNTVMIATEKLAKKLNIELKETPKWMSSGWLAWVLLIGFAPIMMLLKKAGIDFSFMVFLLIISMLVTLRYKPEVFHNKICPFGVLQKLTGRFAYFSRNVDPSKCVGCGLCEKACPSRAIVVSTEDKKAKIEPNLCHQCLSCTIVCPKGAIDYGKIKKKQGGLR
ncbi:MAG: 4Fe-4S binding protein [Bacillota bacterium]|nr:4Fe-4S binding protein [Bacillota bacterium]